MPSKPSSVPPRRDQHHRWLSATHAEFVFGAHLWLSGPSVRHALYAGLSSAPVTIGCVRAMLTVPDNLLADTFVSEPQHLSNSTHARDSDFCLTSSSNARSCTHSSCCDAGFTRRPKNPRAFRREGCANHRASSTYSTATNDAGQVTGVINGPLTGNGLTRPFLWDSVHGMTDLGLLPGMTDSYTAGMNQVGQVFGPLDAETDHPEFRKGAETKWVGAKDASGGRSLRAARQPSLRTPEPGPSRSIRCSGRRSSCRLSSAARS